MKEVKKNDYLPDRKKMVSKDVSLIYNYLEVCRFNQAGVEIISASELEVRKSNKRVGGIVSRIV